MGTRGVPRLEDLRPWIFCPICGDELRAANGSDVPDERHLTRHEGANAAHHWGLSATCAKALQRLRDDGRTQPESPRESKPLKVLRALGYAVRVNGDGSRSKAGVYLEITEAGRKWLETEREKKR